MARRTFGSVRRLPSGRWQARYCVDSSRREDAPTTFPTKRDALEWLATVESDMARGRWVDPDRGRDLLADYAWSWLHAKVEIGPRTREIYAAQLRLHVLPNQEDGPALGGYALAELTPQIVRQWYRCLADARGASVAAKAYVRLRQILGQAVDDELIVRNPCRIPKGGREDHPEQRFLDMPALTALVPAVPPRYRALVLVAALGGLRQGELFALRRADIDLEAGVVNVRRKRLRLASGTVIEDRPKSRAGIRTVALPQTVVDELGRHLTRYTGAGSDAYIFITTEGQPVERSNFLHRVWAPAVKEAGLQGLRFHDLRHTAGTLAAQTGATTKELMARLGHASPQAAMVYQHAASDRDVRIAARLDTMATEAGLTAATESTENEEALGAGFDGPQ